LLKNVAGNLPESLVERVAKLDKVFDKGSDKGWGGLYVRSIPTVAVWEDYPMAIWSE